ncbi:hypothetical protein A1O3_06515 [Capronia epimyces CBS 606.96]|uniref:Major facilitator superfamily (MFS) profile domain-containing protein n=1 Tax=Capronia epimyces CBS 606.96 TaxID=1182542 RepID=W9Y0D4_9EURO|nr:uncharacterized protein A1O3_06515 [Capronia epimyces CBS 606.96]EXJ82701.1 hypothetical protein A1O3_06515 [Capronia epimyces CBS 606.96]
MAADAPKIMKPEQVEDVTGLESSVEKQSDGGDAVVDVQQEDEKISWRLGLAFAALVFQVICYETTLLIPSTILSYIEADLGPDPSYTWIANAWSLCAAVVVSIAGRLGDIFGRRYFMLCGSTLAFVGAIIGATAHGIPQMIVSGIFFGIAAGIQETYYACLMELVPYKRRTFFIGLGCVCALPALISPLIAYAMMDHYSWRACYWYMCAIGAVSFLLLFFFYNPPNFENKYNGTKNRLELAKEIDYVGLVLFTSAGVLLLVGLNFGGRAYPWKSTETLVPLILGLVLWPAFGVWECYTKSKLPLMPTRLFRNIRSFVVVLVVCFVSGMFYYSLPVLWPKETALFVPASETIRRGAYAALTNIGTWVAGISLVLIFSRLDHERWQIVFCLVIQIALTGSLASVGVNDNAQVVVTVFLLSCFVNQPLFISFSIISLALEDQADIGVASGVLSTIRLMGGAIGVAIYTTILSNVYTPRLIRNINEVVSATGFPENETSVLLKAAVANTAAAYKAVPHITSEVITLSERAVKKGNLYASGVVWLTAVAFGGLSVISACFIRSTPRSRKTATRAVKLQNELSTVEASRDE